MIKKTSREIAIAWIEANKNNKGIDVAGNKQWVSEKELRFKLFDMYRHMCNKYGKANIWNMNAEELLNYVDEYIDEMLNEEKK